MLNTPVLIPPPAEKSVARFLSHLKPAPEDGDCWEWQGYRDGRGYGRFQAFGRVYLAHRIAIAWIGKVDPGQNLVCHRCDNPPCCNPSHLFVGSHADNAADASAKGRVVPSRGEASGKAKLTAVQAAEILQDKFSTNAELARKYGVTASHISHMKSGVRWAHVSSGRPRRGVSMAGSCHLSVKLKDEVVSMVETMRVTLGISDTEITEAALRSFYERFQNERQKAP